MHAEIIAKLEKLTGPDREVDARIAVACGDVEMRGNEERGFAFFQAPVKRGDWAFLSGCRNGEDDAYRSLGQCLNVSHYTASLDAANALVERVLPGREWSVGNRDIGGDPWGKVRVGPLESIQDSAPTPAIALLIAMFRALDEAGRRAAGGNDAE